MCSSRANVRTVVSHEVGNEGHCYYHSAVALMIDTVMLNAEYLITDNMVKYLTS
jgi:hypothetical protein